MTPGAEDESPSLLASALMDARLRHASILIVDDEPLVCRLLAGLLRKRGFLNVRVAEGGLAALEQVRSCRPDLVLLDMHMPDVDGLQVCQEIRSLPDLVDMPILIHTATADRKELSQLFSAGASDFLSKPISPSELVARVVIHLERRNLLQNMRDYKQRISLELEAARCMQLDLLPSPASQAKLAEAAGLRIASYSRASSELGGDIWGMLPMGEGRFGVFLADFAGHGVTAALNTFRLHALIHEYKPLHDDPAGLLSKLNERLVRLLPAEQFATFLYLIVDAPANRVRFASAGAPPFVVAPGLFGPPHVQEAPALPLGISRGANYEEHAFDFGPDFMILLFSDGLSEFSGKSGHRGGDVGVVEALKACHPGLTPFEVIDQLCRSSGITPNGPLPDDTTIVCIDRRVGAKAMSCRKCMFVADLPPGLSEACRPSARVNLP